MKPINEFLRKTNQEYLFHDYKTDIATLIKYCNMLAEKINEVIGENEKLKKEIDKLKGEV